MQGRRAVVVGAGASGRSAVRLLLLMGARVTLLDRHGVDEAFREEAESKNVDIHIGPHGPEHFTDAGLVVPSPGIPPSKILDLLPEPRPECISELELAARCVHEPIVAITGTNGKTTCATLAAHMLEYSGMRTFLGGNIGTPLSDYVLAGVRRDILVLEVSSFQLQLCSRFRPWVGVLLNFSPNHLDHHADEQEYFRAKLKLFENQQEYDLAIVPQAMREDLEAREFTRARVVGFRPKQRFHGQRLPGRHNQENMEAAYQACRYFGITECEAQLAINEFEPLPHRLEPVAEKGGVLFVNDSKATTVEALRAALETFERPVLLLAGGVFKGGDLAGLVPLMRGKVKAVCLYGAGQETFRAAWNGDLRVLAEETLDQAVRRLAAEAEPGDVVLLSPATASFDQYPDYKARGEHFKRVVEEL
jgi:UDP-N-acetylmuramoylalanine--D-glutamate ligase